MLNRSSPQVRPVIGDLRLKTKIDKNLNFDSIELIRENGQFY